MKNQNTQQTSLPSRQTLRKVTVAAVAGTIIEWFDFAIYGFMAPTIAMLFFPAADDVVRLLQTFAVFAVSFALRPIGGMIFGRMGDRVGRKRVLALTVLLMSAATAAIGLLPGYASIGIWATVLLTLARCLQGLSAGGEYAGAVTYVIEHAPNGERSRYSSWMPAATFAAFSGAALLLFVLTSSLSAQAMADWGWRVVGMYIRHRLDESPLFQQILDGPPVEHTPMMETLRIEWKPMVKLGSYISLTALSFYIFSTYMTTFLREVIGLPSGQVLLTNVVALTFAACAAPFIGMICDAIGRRATMITSAILLGGLSVPAYLLASDGNIANALFAQLILALGAVTANVVTAVLLCEVFPTRVRYTASAITYNISYAVFGGTAPFVATYLIATTGNKLAPAIYITVVAVGALIAALSMPETANRPLEAHRSRDNTQGSRDRKAVWDPLAPGARGKPAGRV